LTSRIIGELSFLRLAPDFARERDFVFVLRPARLREVVLRDRAPRLVLRRVLRLALRAAMSDS
jgi:hypothetical protein